MTADASVPGIESVPRLARWLEANGVPAAGELPSVHLILGGRSNLTYRLEFPATAASPAGTQPLRLILRRPPLGHVLPTAHDMTREYRLISALHGTSVPVAGPVAFCSDIEVIGAPFYVMEFVDGAAVRTPEQAAAITPAQGRAISEELARMLATIHGVDVTEVGLGDFGRPDGYMRRQFSRWQKQWALSASRDVPGYDELVARLEEGLPEHGEGTLVHGDFRLDNVLLVLGAPPASDPRIAAVVDWEMATLGDPLADLGLTLIYWADPGEPDWLDIDVGATATAGPGFLTRAEFAATYAEQTGRDLSKIGYYMAFGCFKLAVVLEGINARFLQRKTVGEGFDREGKAVPVLIQRAHRMLDAPPL
jgi:aminoglycoside phosphotransferase (APT) family kinase protein